MGSKPGQLNIVLKGASIPLCIALFIYNKFRLSHKEVICLNKRQENLLTTLLLKEEFINVNKIANDFECSERTIRNDCKYIDEWLSTFVMLISKENLILELNLVEMEQTKYW